MANNSSRMGLVPPETFYYTPRQPPPQQSTSVSADTNGAFTWVPRNNSPIPGPNYTPAGRAPFPRTNNSSASTPATTNVPSTQPRLKAKRRNVWEKADRILVTIGKEFDSFAHFLEVMFYNRISGVPDPRTIFVATICWMVVRPCSVCHFRPRDGAMREYTKSSRER
ncbi:hypothetical protein C8R44DRAFT_745040 [Mycena epipterygia]|nr:hypothetical protein C8R44DRAFT_745040 [Mycena epipterygia]